MTSLKRYKFTKLEMISGKGKKPSPLATPWPPLAYSSNWRHVLTLIGGNNGCPETPVFDWRVNCDHIDIVRAGGIATSSANWLFLSGLSRIVADFLLSLGVVGGIRRLWRRFLVFSLCLAVQYFDYDLLRPPVNSGYLVRLNRIRNL